MYLYMVTTTCYSFVAESRSHAWSSRLSRHICVNTLPGNITPAQFACASFQHLIHEALVCADVPNVQQRPSVERMTDK
jgi:hypothetical protein